MFVHFFLFFLYNTLKSTERDKRGGEFRLSVLLRQQKYNLYTTIENIQNIQLTKIWAKKLSSGDDSPSYSDFYPLRLYWNVIISYTVIYFVFERHNFLPLQLLIWYLPYFAIVGVKSSPIALHKQSKLSVSETSCVCMCGFMCALIWISGHIISRLGLGLENRR